jgi:opacity protein-like surface antigen
MLPLGGTEPPNNRKAALMNWRSVSTVLVLGILFAPAAHANWYVAFFVGLNDVDDTTLVTDRGTLDTTYDSGFALGLAVGYEFKNGLRLEGEILSERENDADLHRLDGVEQPGSAGTLEHEVGILNLYYDFRREARVSPYLGVGAGVAEVTLVDYGYEGSPDPFFAEKNVLAYQAIAGLGVALPKNWSLQFDARYITGEDPEFNLEGMTTELSYSAFSLTAGVRYTF